MRGPTLLQRAAALPYSAAVIGLVLLIGATAAAQSPIPPGSDLARVVAAARDKSTITLGAGRYPGQVVVENKSLTINGAGEAQTVLTGGKVATVVIVGKGGRLVMRGLSLAPRPDEGLAVLVEAGGEATIERCAVVDTTSAFRVTSGKLTLGNCRLERLSGPAIRAQNDATLSLSRVDLVDLRDNGIVVASGTAQLDKVLVERGSHAGLVAAGKSSVTISNSRFIGLTKGSIVSEGLGPLDVSDCTIDGAEVGIVRLGGDAPLTIARTRFDGRGDMRAAVEVAGPGSVTIAGNEVRGAKVGFVLRESRAESRITGNTVLAPATVSLVYIGGAAATPARKDLLEISGNRFLSSGIVAVHAKGVAQVEIVDNLVAGGGQAGINIEDAVSIGMARNLVAAERTALRLNATGANGVRMRGDLLLSPDPGVPDSQLGDGGGELRALLAQPETMQRLTERLAALRRASDSGELRRAAGELRQVANELRREVGIGSGDPRRLAMTAPARSPLPLGLDDPASFHRRALRPGGVLALSFRDISMPAPGRPLELVRSYRSNLPHDVGFGPGWGWTFGVRIRRPAAPARHLELIEADGTLVRLLPAGDGVYRGRFAGTNGEVRTSATGYARHFADGLVERFDSSGRLVERTSGELGRLQTIGYSPVGIASVTDTAGHRLRFLVDKGRIAAVGDELGRRHSYRYDSAGRLAEVTDPLGRKTQISYSAQGKLAGMTLTDGSSLAIGYDAAGRVASLQGPGELRTRADHIVDTAPHGERRIQTTLTDAESRTAKLTAMDGVTGSSISAAMGADPPVTVSVLGSKSRITGPDGRAAELSFDANGVARQLRDLSGAVHDVPALSRQLAARSPARPAAEVDDAGLPLFVEVDGRRLAVRFDAAGRITEVRAASGAVERFEYDEGDRLVRHLDAAGLATTREHDAADRLVRLVDPSGITQEIRYDGRGLPVELKRAGAPPTTLTYDRSGLLVGRRVGADTTRYEYDGARRLTGEIDAAGNRATLEYGPLGRIVAATIPGRGRVAFEYDVNGVLARVTRGDGTASFTRAADGTVSSQRVDGTTETARPRPGGGWIVEHRAGPELLSRKTHGAGGRLERLETPGRTPVQLRYDERGRPVELASAAGLVRYQWDGLDRLTRITGATGIERMFSYDDAGRMLEASSSTGEKRRLGYDSAGRLAMVEDERGQREEYRYDESGRLTEEHGPGGARRYGFDAEGRTNRIEFSDGLVLGYVFSDDGLLKERTASRGTAAWRWQYRHDGLGRLVSTLDPDGRQESLEYDAAGRVALQRIGESESRIGYDSAGRIVSVETDGVPTHYAYDAAGRLNAVDGKPVARRGTDGSWAEELDGAGRAWRSRFDGNGHILEQLDPAGGKVVFEREQAGRTLRRQDSDGRILLTERDPGGRLVAFGSPDSIRRFTWGPSGELRAERRPDGRQIDWQRDAAGRLERLSADGRPLVTWKRDDRGRPIEIEDPLGQRAVTYGAADEIEATRDPDGRTLRYRYDSLLRLVSVATPEGETTTYAYDAQGDVSEQRGPDGQATRFARDRQRRLTAVTWPDGSGATLTYAADGGLAVLAYRGRDGSLVERRLERDEAGRVVSLQVGERRWQFAYDAVGRLIGITEPDGKKASFAYDRAGNVVGIDGTRLVYDQSYRLVRRGEDVASHDANGNLTSLGDLRLDYDIEGRVVAARRGTVEVRYKYDYAGRLSERRRGDDVMRYLYQLNSRRPSAVYDGSGRRLAWIERGAELDAVRAHTAAGAFVVPVDELGTPFDPRSGPSAPAFGRAATGTSLPGGVLGYAGAITDEETGLVFFDARGYLPEIARFVSPDPAGPEGEANPYAYAANDPIAGRDPAGTKFEMPFGPPGVAPNPVFPGRADINRFVIMGDQARHTAGADIIRDLYRVATDPSQPAARRRVAAETFDALVSSRPWLAVQDNPPGRIGPGTYGRVSPTTPHIAHVYPQAIRNGTADLPASQLGRRIAGAAVHEMTHVAQNFRPLLPGQRAPAAMREFEAILRQWIYDPSIAGVGRTFRGELPMRAFVAEALTYASGWDGYNRVSNTYIERLLRGYFPELSPREIREAIASGRELAQRLHGVPDPAARPPGHATQRLPAVERPPPRPGSGASALDDAARAVSRLDDAAAARVAAARAGTTAMDAVHVGGQVLGGALTGASLVINTYQYLNGDIGLGTYVVGVGLDAAALAGLLPTPLALAYAAPHVGAFLGDLAAAAVIAELRDPNSSWAGLFEAVFDLPPIRSHPAAGHPCEAVSCDCNGIEAGLLTRPWRQDCRQCEAGIIQACLEASQRMPPQEAVRTVGSCKNKCSVKGPGAR